MKLLLPALVVAAGRARYRTELQQGPTSLMRASGRHWHDDDGRHKISCYFLVTNFNGEYVVVA